MVEKFKNDIINGRNEVINDVKILLYKEDPDIFDRIDFEDDNIYREPLLIAYFRSKSEGDLDLNTILYGYTAFNLRPEELKIVTDEYARVYLPNMGWLHLEESHTNYKLVKDSETEFIVKKEEKECHYRLEKPHVFKETDIELLQYSIPNFKQFYYDSNQNLLDVEIEKITQKHLENVENALVLIKKHVPHIYESLSIITSSLVVFNLPLSASGGVRRNSFAVPSGLGTAFFNAYQETYNEVFFVDDIAHQTGHVVFHALMYQLEEFIKVAPDTVIQKFTSESRDILVIMHALYTYYSTLTSFNALLDENVFTDDKKHEVLGRMRFYIGKCNSDIHLLEHPEDPALALDKLLTEKGLFLFNEIKKEFEHIADKWWPIVGDFDISNQPYNFTFSNFIALNPIPVADNI